MYVVTCFINSELNSVLTSQISLVAFSLVYNYIRTPSTPTAHWLHFGVSASPGGRRREVPTHIWSFRRERVLQ